MGKKIKYEKSSAILIFLVHTVMIRFSALSAYLLLIPKGWRFFETGRYYGTRQLFNFLRTGKLFQTNLWCLFEKDQEDCWTDMLSLDLSWPERIAKKSSSQNLKAWSFVWRNCTHIRITYNSIYMHAHLYAISTAAFKILWVSFEKVLKSGQDFTEAGRELKRLAAQSLSLERKHEASSLRFLGQCSSYRALSAALNKYQPRRSLIGNQPNLNRVFTEFT